MNDYLMLGATIGIPALLCLLGYIWLSLREVSGARRQVSGGKREVSGAKCQDMAGSLNLKLRTRNSEPRNNQVGRPTMDWPQVACRAGALVLAVGFWFDGGLFTLPTAANFWILLELGRDRDGTTKEQSNKAVVRTG